MSGAIQDLRPTPEDLAPVNVQGVTGTTRSFAVCLRFRTFKQACLQRVEKGSVLTHLDLAHDQINYEALRQAGIGLLYQI